MVMSNNDGICLLTGKEIGDKCWAGCDSCIEYISYKKDMKEKEEK